MTPSRGLQNGNSNILGRIQGGVPYDGQWHNIIWAWNTNTGGSSPWVINSTLDRAPVGETVVNLGSSTSGFSVDYAVTDQWIVCSEAGLGPVVLGLSNAYRSTALQIGHIAGRLV